MKQIIKTAIPYLYATTALFNIYLAVTIPGVDWQRIGIAAICSVLAYRRFSTSKVVTNKTQGNPIGL